MRFALVITCFFQVGEEILQNIQQNQFLCNFSEQNVSVKQIKRLWCFLLHWSLHKLSLFLVKLLYNTSNLMQTHRSLRNHPRFNSKTDLSLQLLSITDNAVYLSNQILNINKIYYACCLPKSKRSVITTKQFCDWFEYSIFVFTQEIMFIFTGVYCSNTIKWNSVASRG